MNTQRRVTAAQVKELRRQLNQGASLRTAAMRANMDRKSARKYRTLGQLPSPQAADVEDLAGCAGRSLARGGGAVGEGTAFTSEDSLGLAATVATGEIPRVHAPDFRAACAAVEGSARLAQGSVLHAGALSWPTGGLGFHCDERLAGDHRRRAFPAPALSLCLDLFQLGTCHALIQ